MWLYWEDMGGQPNKMCMSFALDKDIYQLRLIVAIIIGQGIRWGDFL